jgi:Flp pilus assembly protein TadD
MLEEIAELHKQGKLEEAEQRYRELLTFNPDDPETLHLLGMLRRQRDDAREALTLVRRAIELSPGRAPYYMTLGAIEMHARQLEAARADFETALRLDPNLTAAYGALAQIALLQGDNARADANFKLAGRTEGERVDVLVGQGNLLLTQGDTDGAIRYLTRAAELFPQDAAPQASLGRAYLSKGMQAFAEQALNNALRLKPDFHAARIVLAETLMLGRRFDEAQVHLRQLLAIPGQIAPALAMMGDAFRARDDLGRAITFYRDSLAQQRAQPRVMMALAWCLAQRRLLREAIAAWREAVHMLPDALDPRHGLAACCAEAGLHDEAREAWGFILQQQPADAAARAGVAALAELDARFDEATQQAQVVLAADPVHAGAALIVARAALRAGDAAAAVRQLDALDASRLNAPQRRLRGIALGVAHDALGAPAAAVAAWRAGQDDANAPAFPLLPPPASGIVGEVTRARAITPQADGRRPHALLLGAPGSGVEAVARLLTALPDLHLLSDRLGPAPRQDGFSIDEVHFPVNGDVAHRFARKYTRPLERLGLAADVRVVDWLPLLDVRALPAALAAFGRVRAIVVARDPRDAFLNWLAFGCAAGWRVGEAGARPLARCIAQLDAAVELLGDDVLLLSGDAAVAEPDATLAKLVAFLDADAARKRAPLPETGLGGLPRSLPAGRHADYAAVLEDAFADLA